MDAITTVGMASEAKMKGLGETEGTDTDFSLEFEMGRESARFRLGQEAIGVLRSCLLIVDRVRLLWAKSKVLVGLVDLYERADFLRSRYGMTSHTCHCFRSITSGSS